MFPGNETGHIPVKYFKEIKNIHTGEILDVNTANTCIVKHCLNPMNQEYMPKNLTVMTSINTYCAKLYDQDHAWKDLA